MDKVLTKKDIFEIQDLVNEILISDSIFEYVMNLVEATRFPEKYGLDLKKYISY
jgi:MoxR-like ATPase